MGAAENKALVKRWMSMGQTIEGCGPLATEDFTWFVGKGTAPLITGGPSELHGEEALRMMDRIGRAIYDGGTRYEPIFLVAEGDWVVAQARISARTFEGDEYTNVYVFSYKCRDGKVAEFWEHTDTKFWHDMVVGQPERYDAMKQRLAKLPARRAVGEMA